MTIGLTHSKELFEWLDDVSGGGVRLCELEGDVINDSLIVWFTRICFEASNGDAEDDDDGATGDVDANESSTAFRRFCKRIFLDLGDNGDFLYSWALIINDVEKDIVILICLRIEVKMQTEWDNE